MTTRIALVVVAVVALLAMMAAPAFAYDQNPLDCEGSIKLFCPGPLP